MFLHIGKNTDIFISDIVMLLNLPNTGAPGYPNLISLTRNPKTLVITNHNGCDKYYLSGIRISTLSKRILKASK